ncbi:Rossmann-like and DUF2520 domain-containing protein [Trichloromonas sp.]|uniref:Rossmann-like and DUF2520 domain-containing protein n=1 Tax=Trichloromonas sp. TaxID=3069249 RepID=UPI002A4CEB03|nr:DUF2520 domain-containing protein [Trichloromonas sp.]
MKQRIVLIGPGRLGQAVTALLAEAGHSVRAIIGRDAGRALAAARFVGSRDAATTDLNRAAQGNVVLLAVPDDALAETAAGLRRQGQLAEGAVLIHFSGRHPAAILNQGEGPKVRALSLHPLQTFADTVGGVRNLPGTPFSVEGDEDLVAFGEQLVRDMGGTPFRILADRKPLYHAAACVASNYLVTLAAVAGRILARCGFPEDEAVKLLIPLLHGTVHNLTALDPPRALTGPIARGDIGTVADHLNALEELPDNVRQIYRLLGRETVELAIKKGSLDKERAEALRELLK